MTITYLNDTVLFAQPLSRLEANLAGALGHRLGTTPTLSMSPFAFD